MKIFGIAKENIKISLILHEMKIFFEQKKPGRTKQTIEPVAVEIDGCPASVGALIEVTVRSCVAAFNKKAASSLEDPDIGDAGEVLDEQGISNLVETGRVAFGIVYGNRQADADKAVANALQCYEDGMFRMFLNGVPLGDIHSPVEVREGACLSVVRLTLLAGRMW